MATKTLKKELQKRSYRRLIEPNMRLIDFGTHNLFRSAYKQMLVIFFLTQVQMWVLPGKSNAEKIRLNVRSIKATHNNFYEHKPVEYANEPAMATIYLSVRNIFDVLR